MTSFRFAKKCANCDADLSAVPVVVFSIHRSPVVAGVMEQPVESLGHEAKRRFAEILEHSVPEDVETSPPDFNLDLSEAREKPAPPVSTIANHVAVETPDLKPSTLEEDEIEVEGLGFEPEEQSSLGEEVDLSNVEENPAISIDLDSREEDEVSLRIEEEPAVSLDFEEPKHESVALAIEDLEPSGEPQPLAEPIPDPRLAIEDLDLTLEIVEPESVEIEIPESSIDGIKLEIEDQPDKDSPPPQDNK